MTNTKFRKRALLSSVAMLLVALVALGSATFAWFAQNPTVTASGMKAQVTASPGLAIASESDKLKTGTYTFGYTATLASYDAALLPASPNAGAELSSLDLPFATATGTAHDNGAINSDFNSNVTPFKLASYANDAFTPGTGSSVYYEDVYLSQTDTGSAVDVVRANVRINTKANVTIASAIRVALVAKNVNGESTSYSLLGIWKPTGATDNANWAGGTAKTSVEASPYACTASDTNKEVALKVPYVAGGTSTTPTGTTVRVYIYLDGQDSATISDNAPGLTEMVNSIDVGFSTSTSGITFSN